jgi:hypothetical protein
MVLLPTKRGISMEAYIVTLLMCDLTAGSYAVAIILRANTYDEEKLVEAAITRLNKPKDVMLDSGVELIGDNVLVALATIAQGKGLL